MSFLSGQVVTTPIVLPTKDDSALVILPEAGECRACHRAVRLFINRYGESRCVSCSTEKERKP